MQVLGIVDIVWQGRNIPIEDGAKVKLGGIINKPVKYGRKVGRAQMFEASEVEAKTEVEKGQRLKDLYQVGEGELQVQCDTGQIYIWQDAFLVDQREFEGKEGGKVPLKWACGDYEEVLP